MASADFDEDAIFTNDAIQDYKEVIRVLDNTDNGNTIQLNLNRSRIKILLRTMLTQGLRKNYGNGFRILVYYSGKFVRRCYLTHI